MAAQLDILALEPFYGGIRRSMLETIVRCSRHRWTLLKLPPRRIERRLSAAAVWFAEQLSRHWVGPVDVVFTSEAMNLADLHRRVPVLATKPAIVYFHSNQLPHSWGNDDDPLHLVNVTTATAATQLWFNSLSHLRCFYSRAGALIERHPDLAARSPMPDLVQKAHLMPPPIDLSFAHDADARSAVRRRARAVFVETRDADTDLLNTALAALGQMNEPFSLITVGPVEDLLPDLPRRTVSERDEAGQWRALCEAGVFVSTRVDAPCDPLLVRALSVGCWPIVPNLGVYPEALPEAMHIPCLYDGTPDMLVNRLLDAWNFERPDAFEREIRFALEPYNPVTVCRAIDERLDELAGARR